MAAARPAGGGRWHWLGADPRFGAGAVAALAQWRPGGGARSGRQRRTTYLAPCSRLCTLPRPPQLMSSYMASGEPTGAAARRRGRDALPRGCWRPSHTVIDERRAPLAAPVPLSSQTCTPSSAPSPTTSSTRWRRRASTLTSSARTSPRRTGEAAALELVALCDNSSRWRLHCTRALTRCPRLSPGHPTPAAAQRARPADRVVERHEPAL